MFETGNKVMAEVDLRENPWAQAGTVVAVYDTCMIDTKMVEVAWPGARTTTLELDWTLRIVSDNSVSTTGDDVSRRDAQRIAAAEWNRL